MNPTRYKVKKGDSLREIARQHGVSLAALAHANGITDIFHRPRAGDVLWIPARPAPKPQSSLARPATHQVRLFDNFHDIAQLYGVTEAALHQANSSTPPGLLWVGQTLTLPVAEGTPSNGTVRAGQSAAASEFSITDIPAIMLRQNPPWKQAARLMRRWFSGDAYVMPGDVKRNRVDDRLLGRSRVLDDLPFDWLLSSSKRVKPVLDDLMEQLDHGPEFNGLFGRTKGVLDQLSPGLVQLMWRLERLGLLDTGRKRVVKGSSDFTNLPAIQLEQKSQINFITIGTSFLEKALDEFDDVYGALGAFAIKIAFTQARTETDREGFSVIHIDEIGLYVRDTYEFRNEPSDDDQTLGYWGPEGVSRFPWNGDEVTNNSFNTYRDANHKGGDFVIYSTVKKVEVSFIIHLNDADFMEYLDKRPGAR